MSSSRRTSPPPTSPSLPRNGSVAQPPSLTPAGSWRSQCGCPGARNSRDRGVRSIGPSFHPTIAAAGRRRCRRRNRHRRRPPPAGSRGTGARNTTAAWSWTKPPANGPSRGCSRTAVASGSAPSTACRPACNTKFAAAQTKRRHRCDSRTAGTWSLFQSLAPSSRCPRASSTTASGRGAKCARHHRHQTCNRMASALSWRGMRGCGAGSTKRASPRTTGVATRTCSHTVLERRSRGPGCDSTTRDAHWTTRTPGSRSRTSWHCKRPHPRACSTRPFYWRTTAKSLRKYQPRNRTGAPCRRARNRRRDVRSTNPSSRVTNCPANYRRRPCNHTTHPATGGTPDGSAHSTTPSSCLTNHAPTAWPRPCNRKTHPHRHPAMHIRSRPAGNTTPAAPATKRPWRQTPHQSRCSPTARTGIARASRREECVNSFQSRRHRRWRPPTRFAMPREQRRSMPRSKERKPTRKICSNILASASWRCSM
mmetsp:Transcript_22384/g.64333  ORF Transcript_22384/g.64333 Transcript_22384/m.64333 type:complete len:479 (+) Transcript_22384:1182-2618(+)